MKERPQNRIRKKLLIKVDGHTCVMVDMSRTGMKLVIPFLLKKRQVDITFQVEDMMLEVTGSVRWIRKEPTVYEQSQYQVGLLIADPPEEYVQLVEKLLEE